ncbi:carbohydrate kinase family protein [Botrimarina sp.]|uniref:carbohydrate kinase family protein n=1 Tax=Botrimarina sp. TaxID=2795802 RepID=UPI0032ECC0ED
MDNKAGAEAVVAGHACLDIIPRMPLDEAYQPGALIEIGPATISTGGAVSNTGLALQRLGARTRLVCGVGRDPFGELVRDRLFQQGADVRLVETPHAATSYSVVLSPAGADRCFLHCPGANDEFSPEMIADDAFRDASVLHFGYPPVMRRTYEDGGAALAGLFRRAQSAGLVTSLDMCGISPGGPASRCDWPAFFRRVLPHVDCFTPSHDELMQMLGRPATATQSLAALSRLANEVLGFGPAVVLIKLGDDGLFAGLSADAARFSRVGEPFAQQAGRSLYEPCYRVPVVGTTGAGDATIAGFLLALLRGQSADDAMRTATAVGACSVESVDATSGVPDLRTVSERIRAGWEKLPSRLA